MRRKVTIKLDEKLVDWIDRLVSEKVEYHNRSHFIEVVLTRFKREAEATKE